MAKQAKKKKQSAKAKAREKEKKEHNRLTSPPFNLNHFKRYHPTCGKAEDPCDYNNKPDSDGQDEAPSPQMARNGEAAVPSLPT
jgi:hypothetical protein